MKKPIKLTNEERIILTKLSAAQLEFFSKLREDKDFFVLTDVINSLIDIEKNIFFKEDESKVDPMVLYAQHAYSRGGIAKLIALVHIIVGAEQELQSREKERLDRQKN